MKRCLIAIMVASLMLVTWREFAMVEEEAIDTPIVQLNHKRGYVRAAIAYFPSEQSEKFGPQLRWFAHSWKDMQLHEPSNWITDIVIVTRTTEESVFSDLNCTTAVRMSRTESGRCRLVSNYTALYERDAAFKSYRFADSIDSVVYAAEQGALDVYDALLRTDLDTFLTPAFSTWKPMKLAVGIGKYCFSGQITCHRLKRIAQDMGLAPKGQVVENVGSTWYGKGSTIVKCANASMQAMRYMNKYEFTKMDKGPKINGKALNWPGWHYGVLSMYGGQIAINYCAQDEGFEKRSDMLDVASSSSDSVFQHAHLHTWQNNKNFSKFAFARNQYANVNPAKLNRTIIKEYALYHALVSKLEATT